MIIEYLRVGSCRHPECIVMRGGAWRNVEFPAVAVLLHHPTRGPWLFDTGYSHRFHEVTRTFPERLYAWTTPFQLPQEECLLTQLAARGILPTDIKGILLSHLHADHCSGVADFAQAEIWLSRMAWDKHLTHNRFTQVRQGFLKDLFPPSVQSRFHWLESLSSKEVKGLGDYVQGWDLWGDDLAKVIPLPGHAYGHVGLFLTDDLRGSTFLLADACWSIKTLTEDRPPSRLSHLIFPDSVKYIQTLKKLRALMIQRPDLRMVPQHCLLTLGELNAL